MATTWKTGAALGAFLVLAVACGREKADDGGWQCEPDPVKPVETRGDGGPPRIDAIEPDRGLPGAIVEVVAANLPKKASLPVVYFGTERGRTEDVSPDRTRIAVRVPADAVSGPVFVEFGETRLEGPYFTVEPAPVPLLDAVDPPVLPLVEDARLRLLGSGFVPQSEVHLDGRRVNRREFVSNNELIISPPSWDWPAGTHRVKVVTPGPDGGTSATVQFETVNEWLDLIGAASTSPTGVRLDFDEAVDPATGNDPDNYTFWPRLEVRSARVDPADPRDVLLETEPQGGVIYYVFIRNLRSASGRVQGMLSGSRIWFRGQRGLPVALSRFGDTGCGNFALSRPSGFGFSGDLSYVTERTGHKVRMFDSAHEDATVSWVGEVGTGAGCPGETGTGPLNAPLGAVVSDPKTGRTYVADTGNDRLQAWGPTTYLLEPFGPEIDRPVLLGAFDGHLWVATGEDRIRRVGFDGGEGPSLGGHGRSPGKFSFGIACRIAPAAALASDGAVLVTDPENHRLQRFVDGKPAGMYGGGRPSLVAGGTSCCRAGVDPGWLTHPRGIAVDSQGVIWVVDEGGGGRVVRLEPDGTYGGERPLGFRPAALGIDRFDRLWIADAVDDVVYVWL